MYRYSQYYLSVSIHYMHSFYRYVLTNKSIPNIPGGGAPRGGQSRGAQSCRAEAAALAEAGPLQQGGCAVGGLGRPGWPGQAFAAQEEKRYLKLKVLSCCLCKMGLLL